jgi:hypothetical protein
MDARRKQESVERVFSLVFPKSGNAAIPFRHPLVRDALVLASLDPAVRSIEYLPTARSANASTDVDAIVLDRDGGRYYLDVIEARPRRSIAQHIILADALVELGLLPWTMSAAEILSEPRWSNARAVWAHAGHAVPVGTRLQVVGALADEGAMALGDLLGRLRGDRDPAPAVMALACMGLIQIDLVAAPIGPATMVRPGR